MAIESGSVRGDLEAVLRVGLAEGESVECVIDTGFSGHLVLPRSVVSRLGLAVIGREVFEMVAGHFLTADIAQADLTWLGGARTVEAVVSEGEDALLGTAMLDGTRLTIDYVSYTVTISDEAS
jgi:clan AA aspartic protease